MDYLFYSDNSTVQMIRRKRLDSYLLYKHGKMLLLACAAVIPAIILYHFDPLHYSFYPPCFFKKFTGLDCAGCGCARALHSLLHGHFNHSIHQNALLLPAVFVVVAGSYHSVTGKGKKLWTIINRPIWVLMIICLFWVLRNIPFLPFLWLRADG